MITIMNKYLYLPKILSRKECNIISRSHFSPHHDLKINKILRPYLIHKVPPEKFSRYEKFNNNRQLSCNHEVLDDISSFTPIYDFVLNFYDHECMFIVNHNDYITLHTGDGLIFDSDYLVHISAYYEYLHKYIY